MYEKIANEIDAQIQYLTNMSAANAYSQQMKILKDLLEKLQRSSSSQTRDVTMAAVNLVEKVCVH